MNGIRICMSHFYLFFFGRKPKKTGRHCHKIIIGLLWKSMETCISLPEQKNTWLDQYLENILLTPSIAPNLSMTQIEQRKSPLDQAPTIYCYPWSHFRNNTTDNAPSLETRSKYPDRYRLARDLCFEEDLSHDTLGGVFPMSRFLEGSLFHNARSHGSMKSLTIRRLWPVPWRRKN